MTLTVALMAPGSMGAAIGARLALRGARVITSLAGRSESSKQRSAAAGLEAVDDVELITADLFLSIVPPASAAELGRHFASLCKGSARSPRYLDLNAVSPELAQRTAREVEAGGAVFVDGAIIGLPAKPDETGPTVYLSGPVGDAADLLVAHGLNAKVLAGDVGAASALKMSYAGMTKGLTALASCMILAADRHSAADALRAELADSQSQLLQRLGKSIPDMLPKAWRWAPEMAEVAAFVGDDRPESGIYRAMASFYDDIAIDLSRDQREVAVLRDFVARNA